MRRMTYEDAIHHARVAIVDAGLTAHLPQAVYAARIVIKGETIGHSKRSRCLRRSKAGDWIEGPPHR